MSRDGVSEPQPILHIGSGRATSAPPGWGAVGEGFALVYCPDVFRAIARVSQESPSAVVVCVDDLQPEEYQFFRLMRRHYTGVPVYAYAFKVPQDQTSLAVRAGATDAWTEEFATRLGNRIEAFQVEHELKASGLTEDRLALMRASGGARRNGGHHINDGNGSKSNGAALTRRQTETKQQESEGSSLPIDDVDRWLMGEESPEEKWSVLRYSAVEKSDSGKGMGAGD